MMRVKIVAMHAVIVGSAGGTAEQSDAAVAQPLGARRHGGRPGQGDAAGPVDRSERHHGGQAARRPRVPLVPVRPRQPCGRGVDPGRHRRDGLDRRLRRTAVRPGQRRRQDPRPGRGPRGAARHRRRPPGRRGRPDLGGGAGAGPRGCRQRHGPHARRDGGPPHRRHLRGQDRLVPAHDRVPAVLRRFLHALLRRAGAGGGLGDGGARTGHQLLRRAGYVPLARRAMAAGRAG